MPTTPEQQADEAITELIESAIGRTDSTTTERIRSRIWQVLHEEELERIKRLEEDNQA